MQCYLYMVLCTIKNPSSNSSIFQFGLVSVTTILDFCKLRILPRVATPANGEPQLTSSKTL